MSTLMRPSSTKTHVSAGTPALLAVGCGTAVASVCAAGLFHIEGLLGGVWSVAAVLMAGLVCWLLARALARLAEVVPSGAGLLAYLARGFGRSPGLLLVVPYVLLTLLLAGAEAVIVGLLFARLIAVPALVGALIFLIVTWLLCRCGLRISYRVQAAATWALVAGLGAVSLAAICQTVQRGELLARLVPAAPSAGHFAAGVGQALFLFMGFELVTSQAEIARTPRSIGRALTGSVGILAGFYSLVSLGFSCLPERLSGGSEALVPQLALADQAGGAWMVVLIAGLSLLASFTSFHGALLALSRFTSALASQGMLPCRLARVEPRTLMPRSALAFLLALAIAAAVLVWFGDALRPSILAAAFAVAVVYAAAVWVRERPPFAEKGRSSMWRWLSGSLSVGLVALAMGIWFDAGPALAATLAILLVAYLAALGLVSAGARRGGRPHSGARPPRLHRIVQVEGASHAP